MNPDLSLATLKAAAAEVHSILPPTPQYSWPLLNQRLAAEVWVKHENHLPVGAFKVRGGVYLLGRLKAAGVQRVIAATRGNHGLSVAFAAQRSGMHATLVVPHGNSLSKNAAMRALGATLIEEGRDFQAALEHAQSLAAKENVHFIPSFSFDLVRGVASYALEFFAGTPRLDRVYVPIGLGSGICGLIAARDALGLQTEIIGVVAAGADCYARSLAAGEIISTPSAETIADGLACRTPNKEAFEFLRRSGVRVVCVADAEIRAAMRHLFDDTHNAAEGAGAAALAGASHEAQQNRGKKIGIILSGGNVDAPLFAEALRNS